uniref:Uncharacterized protein n=1 Tax=Amphimedon queenslandica TaxID=400682 RepID=A0A1X7V5C4_AMPQE
MMFCLYVHHFHLQYKTYYSFFYFH